MKFFNFVNIDNNFFVLLMDQKQRHGLLLLPDADHGYNCL